MGISTRHEEIKESRVSDIPDMSCDIYKIPGGLFYFSWTPCRSSCLISAMTALGSKDLVFSSTQFSGSRSADETEVCLLLSGGMCLLRICLRDLIGRIDLQCSDRPAACMMNNTEDTCSGGRLGMLRRETHTGCWWGSGRPAVSGSGPRTRLGGTEGRARWDGAWRHDANKTGWTPADTELGLRSTQNQEALQCDLVHWASRCCSRFESWHVWLNHARLKTPYEVFNKPRKKEVVVGNLEGVKWLRISTVPNM